MINAVDQWIDNHLPELTKAISESIQIRSVQEPTKEGAPFGDGPKQALEHALALGNQFGFETKNVDNYAGHIQFGREGTLFGVLGHLDVVPEGDGWDIEPYSGIVKDGYIWGRGSIDNKGPCMGALFALAALKETGFHPKHRLRIILGTNEESGWECVRHYFSKEEPPAEGVTPDAAFPMANAEKGIVNYAFHKTVQPEPKDAEVRILSMKGGDAPNMVAATFQCAIEAINPEKVLDAFQGFYAKNPTRMSCVQEGNQLHFVFRGKSAHGSTPEEGINAVSAGLDFLGSLPLSPQWAEIIGHLNQKLGYDFYGLSLGISGADHTSGCLTCNLGVISLEGNELKVIINIRHPIFFSLEMLTKQITEAMKAFEVAQGKAQKPLFVSPDSSLIQSLQKIYHEVTGLDPTPYSMGGGTYARAIPYGVAFGSLFPDDLGLAHQPNERAKIESLVKMVKIYARLYMIWLS